MTTGPAGRETGAPAAPDLGAMLSRLLSDPELIGKIAETAGIPPAQAAAERGAPAGEAASVPTADALGTLMSMLGGAAAPPESPELKAAPAETIRPPKPGSDKRMALLRALRPYCGERRQRTIDYMIALSRFSGSLQELVIPPKK